MINKTLWRPDTCGCEIEYEWDTEVLAEQRVHTLAKHKACQTHRNLGLQDNTQEAYEAVKEENTRKNLVFKTIVETIPEFTVTDAEGNKKHLVDHFHWEFDENRKLHFALTKGNKGQHDQVEAKVNNDFGQKVALKTKAEVNMLKGLN